ncbi:hypothetical protein E1A91_A02G099000v1 [Gossypium mustelinum]|uniref:Uncharacterized protein n=6 Tax=Gossypium TaxID=3633 RepID=A0A5J5WL25_GOSBA|nr:hypothetical protein ES319_A02G095600v1 [Gossypium barbadense]TYH27912.1 hypothetical protein ES288_A02G105000v1 [Gossypium darwinii]TYJ46118.1 hypothetical protein E1A91_A02G099000v1 [Gossypium mustelinum]KAB2093481.1 hypothetical protein ES319_A02G095600v1 [Gossypium barbadense]TYJ46119.1 hypothetical protein E1A91_A02G099000v1 [Gossypium mustelinum]
MRFGSILIFFSRNRKKERKGKMKMASAQALPSSRKQKHLEAGKHRLEEFYKKNAAEKAKKAASTSQTNVSDVSLNEKQQLEYLFVNLNEKLCSIYLSKLIVANENILEKKHDFYSTK